jgi:hypothetical protein
MGNSRAVSGMDRLPWLADDGEASKRSRSFELLLWGVPLLILVAIGSYWLGANGARWFAKPAAQDEPKKSPPPTPALAEEPAAPFVQPLPSPELPAVAEAPPVPMPSVEAPAKPRPVAATAKPKPRAKPKAEAKPSGPVYWPARVVEGSSGRLVRVGTFASRKQAKRGWFALMRVNPSLQRLPALVVPVASARDGKTYYRLQMGTTSQAHSVALCQKLRMIGQSCVVVADETEDKAA